MPPSETFVTDILMTELSNRIKEFNEISDKLNGLRNHLTISTKKGSYFAMIGEKEQMEKRRRELRGEMSALRQAIKKLQEGIV